MCTSKDTFLILGLGNTLLSDEAAGVRTVEYIRGLPEPDQVGLKLMDGGTMGLSLLVEMEDADALIIVDAAFLQKPPGSIQVFEGVEMDDFLRNRGRSPHDIGLDDLMDALRLREAVPARRAVIGIQPMKLTVGEHLTPEVEAAIPKAASAAMKFVRGWSGQ